MRQSLCALILMYVISLLVSFVLFTAFVNDNEARSSCRNCQDKMRMEIKVHPNRHHNHYPKNPDTITTIVKKSPKFSVTKHINENANISSILAKVSKS